MWSDVQVSLQVQGSQPPSGSVTPTKTRRAHRADPLGLRFCSGGTESPQPGGPAVPTVPSQWGRPVSRTADSWQQSPQQQEVAGPHGSALTGAQLRTHGWVSPRWVPG